MLSNPIERHRIITSYNYVQILSFTTELNRDVKWQVELQVIAVKASVYFDKVLEISL